jgi:hypothetical protein
MRKTSNDDLQKKCDEIIAGVISRLVDKNNSAYVTAVPVDRSCMALFLFSRISGLGKIDDNAKKQLLETLLPKEEKKQEAVSQAATNVMKDENEMQKKTREQATMILCNPALTGAMIQLNEYFKRNQTLPRPLVDLVTEYVGSFKEQDLLPVIGAACDDQRFKAVFEKSFPQFEWSEKGPKEKPKDAEKKEDKKDQGNQNEAEKAAAYNAERLASLMEYRNLVGAIVTQLTTPSPSPQSPAGNAMRDREGQQQA